MSEVKRYKLNELDGLQEDDEGYLVYYTDYSLQLNLAARKVAGLYDEVESLKMDYRMSQQSLSVAVEQNVALNKEIDEMRNRIDQYVEDHYKLLKALEAIKEES